MSTIKTYRDLDVWQRAVGLSVKVYLSTDGFPKAEQYGLTSQMRRAGVSIASNIAEGHARSTRDFARFVSIARGSVSELETQLEIARRIGFIPDESFTELDQELSVIGKQLNALLKKLRQ